MHFLTLFPFLFEIYTAFFSRRHCFSSICCLYLEPLYDWNPPSPLLTLLVWVCGFTWIQLNLSHIPLVIVNQVQNFMLLCFSSFVWAMLFIWLDYMSNTEAFTDPNNTAVLSAYLKGSLRWFIQSVCTKPGTFEKCVSLVLAFSKICLSTL